MRSLAFEADLVALAEAARGRDPEQAGRFLEAVAPIMLRVVRQVLGRDHQDIEDTLQEALIGALQALPRFRGDCSVGHFVRRVAFLTALNTRRRIQLRGRLAPPAADSDIESLPTRAQSPADQVEAESRRALFCTLLDELPDAQAEAIGLHCILGYTIGETAAAAGVPVNTVRGRLVSAKAALRHRLERDLTVREVFKGAS